MKSRLVSIAIIAAVCVLVAAGCAPSAPAPAPTKAPAAPAAPAPTKAAAAAPTAAPTVAPTAVPAKKVDYPVKGRSLNIIVGFPAGSPTDVGLRILVDPLEKELGIPVQVTNKPEAGGQSGALEAATAKPDGYTALYASIPTLITMYLNPERKATFGRKDFQPVAVQTGEPNVMSVRTESPYKSVKDVIDAARANPEKVTVAVTGILAPPHLATLQLQMMTDVKFAIVHFDGGAPGTTALLGGHVDFKIGGLSDSVNRPELRPLTVFDKQENKLAPGLKTAEALGYKGNYMVPVRGIAVPAGVPKEIVDVLGDALKRAMQRPDYNQKLEAARLPNRYVGPVEFTAIWDEYEATSKQLMAIVAQKPK